VETKVKKLEEEIKKDFPDKKTGVIKQGAHDYVDKLGDTRIGIMGCLSFFDLGMHDGLGISTTIPMLSGASSMVTTSVASSIVISVISLASSNATILFL